MTRQTAYIALLEASGETPWLGEVSDVVQELLLSEAALRIRNKELENVCRTAGVPETLIENPSWVGQADKASVEWIRYKEKGQWTKV